jgi:SseB protein C-terminal domain
MLKNEVLSVLAKERPSRRPFEELRARAINFVAEQDGQPERNLKTKLVALFGQLQLVRIAYLACVQYENAGPLEVALCVRGQPGQNRMFAARVGEVFASIFGSHEHLDIIWITPEQETALTRVCRPFYKFEAV